MLKLISKCPEHKILYKILQQKFGKRRRLRRGLSENYLNQAKFILEIAEKYKIFKNGHRVLELGTGWTHWLSIVIRLYYDVDIWMFDIVDNRQLEVLQLYSREFQEYIGKQIDTKHEKISYIKETLEAIAKAHKFSEIYDMLNFKYILNPRGKLDIFQDQFFDTVISIDLLEHVNIDLLPEFIRDFKRILRPGGYSIHQFDLEDHIVSFFNSGISRKQYLKYSERVWKRYFENDLLYFNRVQRPEWLALFRTSELELLEENSEFVDIGDLKIDKNWKKFGKKDLGCSIMTVIQKKAYD